MLDLLPSRPLTEDEEETIKQDVERYECMYERDGCMSFVVSVGDGAIGYQYDVFEGEWVETVIARSGEFDFSSVAIKHASEVKPFLQELYEFDLQNGKDYAYMSDV